MNVQVTDDTTVNYATVAAFTSWKFQTGQCVSHKSQIMPSLVMGRTRTVGNRAPLEIYNVRSFADVDPARDRMIVGDSLVDVVHGGEVCQGCLLFNTALCPGVALAA